MKTFLSILMLSSLIGFLSARENPQIDWQFGRLGTDLAATGIIVADIDGNGITEIISTGVYYSSGFGGSAMFFTVLEYSPSEDDYVVDWMSNIIYNTIHSIQLYDVNQDGYFELYIGLDNGMIYVYDTRTFDKVNEFDTSQRGEVPFWEPSNNVSCICFEDINNDSQVNIAATNGDTTYVYNSSYELISKIPFGAKYFEIGNIDDDPYNEVVYSNGRIIQVQNSSIINEYQFQTSNGNVRIGLSDMNADDVKDVVYSSSDTMYVYDFEAKQLIWSQKWESDYGYDKPITGMWFYDYDGDNTKDVFIGNSSRDAVYCYNGVNGNKDFNLADSPIDGIINVAVADLDSDTNLEIIWSTGAYNTGPDYFFVYDLSTLGEDWQSRHYKSDFKAFDVGDVDNDGQLEIVSGCFGEYLQYYDHGFLTVFDAETKNIKWRNDTEIFGNQVEDYTDIKIGDIDNDGKNELLLGVEYDYAFTYVYVFDSIYEVERSFEIHGMSIILDMAIVDIDSDGENELMVTSGTNVSGSSNPDDWQNYIYIFDGASGEIEWQSELLAGVGSTNSLLNIGNIDSDEAFEIVTMLDKRDENFHTLIIVDGTSHEIIQDNSMNYTAVSISDFDNDGKYDILAAVDNGTIEILDGTTLSSKQTINIPCGKINTINTYDLNSDNVMELIFTDNYTLNLFDIANNETKWRSDTINSRVGCFNSLKIGNIDADDKIEILLNANHGIFTFKVNYDSISSVFPVTNYSNQNASRIYPNPTRNKLTIETNIDTPDLFHFKIFDLFGCIVQEEFYSNIYNGNNTTEIDVSDLKPGVYTILLIKDEKILSSNKIIKIP